MEPVEDPLTDDADPFGDRARIAFDHDRNTLAVTKLDTFKEKVFKLPDLTEAQQRFLSDDTLLRYLRARDSDEAAALTMLQATLEWRTANIDSRLQATSAEEYVPPCCQPCVESADAHCFFHLGTDVNGWHVIYSCAARAKNKVVIDNALHMAFELERLFDGNRAPGRMTWIIDLAGFSARDLNPSMALGTLPMFSNHYPERMGQIVCVNVPLLFFGLYRVVTPMMDPVTRSKVVLLRSEAARQQYATVKWSGEHRDAFRVWIDEMLKMPPKPGCFCDFELSRALPDETTVRHLERFVEAGNGDEGHA